MRELEREGRIYAASHGVTARRVSVSITEEHAAGQSNGGCQGGYDSWAELRLGLVAEA